MELEEFYQKYEGKEVFAIVPQKYFDSEELTVPEGGLAEGLRSFGIVDGDIGPEFTGRRSGKAFGQITWIPTRFCRCGVEIPVTWSSCGRLDCED